MRKLGLALILASLGLAPAQAQSNFTMPPPAGVAVIGAQVVAACGAGSLAATQGFVSMDITGALCTNASGGGGGGTSSNFGAAFPATGTAAGFSDGTNMVAGRATSAALADNFTPPTSGLQQVQNFNMVWDGTNWDRATVGVAGTAAAQVHTVQGVASMTPLLATASIPTWAGGTLGAMAAYGTSPGAVLVPGVNAFVTNTNANGSATSANSSPVVIASDQVAVAIKAASGTLASGSMVDVGAQADSVCSTDTGTCTLIALTKRNNARLTTVNTSIGGSNAYETVAASQTGQALGATGATGDYLSHCVIYPTSTTPGVVTVFDNTNAAGSNAIAFPGGASSVSNLAPIAIPVGAVSTAGAWKVTTGANVVVTCYGRFT